MPSVAIVPTAIIEAFDKTLPLAEHRLHVWMAAALAVCLAGCIPTIVWPFFQARGQPGARLEPTRLLLWPARKGEPTVIELADVAAIESTYKQYVRLQMRSGEVRTVAPNLAGRHQKQLLSALRQALAERTPAR